MTRLSPRRILYTLVEAGPRAFLVSAWRKLTGAPVQNQTWTAPQSNRPHPFDLEFATDTGGVLSGESLSTGSRNDVWNTAYYGISPSVLNQTLTALDLDFPRFTFIDLGSGKGRALLLASRFPWQAILGIELAPTLNEAATANIEAFAAPWQLCRTIQAKTGDAATLLYPEGPLVVFLYHPFLGPVLKRCLANLAQSLAAHPRETYILYVNPILKDLVQSVPGMTLLWEQTFSYSEAEADADQLGGTADRVAVFHHRPPPPNPVP